MSGAHRKRILLVDDDEAIAQILGDALPEYELHAVNDGESALEAAKTAPPDLFIIDLVLPEMRGTTLALLLREIPSSSETPIFLISGHFESPLDDGEPTRIQGCPAFAKPFKMSVLRKHVQMHLSDPAGAFLLLQQLPAGRIAGE